MASKVRSVSVVFQAFTDKFNKRLDESSNKAAGFGKKVLAGVGGFIAARATVGAFSSQMEKLTQLANTSTELKVSPQFLQGIDLATEQLGFSFDKAKDVIREFNIRLGEAKTGSGPAVNGLRLINMQIEDFNSMSPEEGFLKVADALSKIEDPQLQIFAAGELFGGAGEDMIGLLQQGEAGLQAFIDKAEELSGPISQEDLDKVLKANQAINELEASMGGFMQQLAIESAPIIESLVTVVTKLSQELKGLGKAWTATQKRLEAFFLAGQHMLGMLTDEEFAYALSLDDQREVRDQTVGNDTQKKTLGEKIKVQIENIQTFAESLRMGTSEAFRALNPSQQVDVQKKQLDELQKQTSALGNIGSKLDSQNKIVSF